MTRVADFVQQIAAFEVVAASRLAAASESEFEAEAVVAALAAPVEETGSATAAAAPGSPVVW